MNLKYWKCPNDNHENIDNAGGFEFRCAKCGKTFKWDEISMYDKNNDINTKEYPYA